MHKLVILIDPPLDPDKFESGWPRFLHWAERMPGLRREVSSRVSSTLYGDHSYNMIHELIFDDSEAAYQALTSPEGQSAGQVLQSITHGRVTLLFAEHMEDTIENLQESRSDHGRSRDPQDSDTR